MSLTDLPDDLPVPQDDGACDHLRGLALPALSLPSTAGRLIDLSDLPGPRTVLYCYPRTGDPKGPLPENWDAIPGARGCTPQSCAFRDHRAELQALGAEIFGLSTQTTAYQQEVVERLHLPFEILSDAELAFVKALNLPTFEVGGMTLIKRLTIIIREKHIEQVFYPVFPPDKNAATVMAWLEANPL